MSRVLEEGEKLGLWRFVRLERGDMLKIPAARAYILGAWHPQYQHLLGAEKTGVLWTSSAGEMEMEPVEIGYLGGILHDPRISFIWFGDPSLAKVYPQKGFFAPYPLSPDLEIPQVEKRRHAVALFNPGGLKKNNLNQLLAVALAQREDPGLVLETNLGVHQQIMDRLGLRYHLHPWLPREQYHRVLASCRVNLAVSWAETYSYALAESFSLGTPCLFSPAISWVQNTTLMENLLVSNPNNSLEIKAKVIKVLSSTEYGELQQTCKDFIKDVSFSRNRELTEALIEHGFLPAGLANRFH